MFRLYWSRDPGVQGPDPGVGGSRGLGVKGPGVQGPGYRYPEVQGPRVQGLGSSVQSTRDPGVQGSKVQKSSDPWVQGSRNPGNLVQGFRGPEIRLS